MPSARTRKRFMSELALCGVGFAAILLAAGRTGAADKPEKQPRPFKSKVVTWQDARSIRDAWGEMRVHFAGETFGTKDAFTAVAVVEPGKAVHAAHRHAEEEYLILAEGSGVWYLDGREFPAKKGDVLYVEPWVFHGLKNTGEKPLTFVVVRYNAKGIPIPPRPDNGKDELPNP